MLFVVGVFAQEAHHLGDGSLDGDVARSNDANAIHIATGGLLAHLYRAGLTLGDIEDDDAAQDGLFQGRDKPFVCGRVP